MVITYKYNDSNDGISCILYQNMIDFKEIRNDMYFHTHESSYGIFLSCDLYINLYYSFLSIFLMVLCNEQLKEEKNGHNF